LEGQRRPLWGENIRGCHPSRGNLIAKPLKKEAAWCFSGAKRLTWLENREDRFLRLEDRAEAKVVVCRIWNLFLRVMEAIERFKVLHPMF
jgi:hypothetical protein